MVKILRDVPHFLKEYARGKVEKALIYGENEVMWMLTPDECTYIDALLSIFNMELLRKQGPTWYDDDTYFYVRRRNNGQS